jgi:hypothetical protein
MSTKPGETLRLTTPGGVVKGRISMTVAPDGNVSLVPEKSLDGKTFTSSIDDVSVRFGNTEIAKNAIVIDGNTFTLNSGTGDIEVIAADSEIVKTYADRAATEQKINELQKSMEQSNQDIDNLQIDLGREKEKIVTMKNKLEVMGDEGKELISINSKTSPATVLSLAEINEAKLAINSVFSRFYSTTKNEDNDTYDDQTVDTENGIDIQVSTLSLLDVLKYAASIEKELRLLREKVLPNGPVS